MNLSDIFTSITIGLLATTSPCVLPLYPGFLAYLSGRREQLGAIGRYFLGFFVLLGVLTMMLLLGGVIALLAVPIGSALRWVIPVADGILLTLGVLLVLNINPFKQFPQIQVPGISHPFGNAFLYGLVYGPITLPCSGPLVVSIFAISLTAGEAITRLTTFLWFGLGFGLPLLILSFLAGGVQRWITRFFALHSRWINLAGGLLLIGVAVYDLAVNWELIFAS